MAPNDPVRIVDVDANISNPLPVSSVPVALLHVEGTAALLGDNLLIAAPGAGLEIKVVSFLIQNTTGVATTMRIIAGAGGVGWPCLAQNQGDGLAKTFPKDREWPLGDNTALLLNLSGANACYYAAMYYVD